MAMGSDVRLPRAQLAEFPDRCVHCSKESPNDLLNFTEVSFARMLFSVLPSRGFSVQVPVCASCRRSCGAQSWRRTFAILGSVVLGIAGSVLLTPGSHRGTWAWLTFVINFVAIAPVMIWQFARPASFGMTVYDDAVVYAFGSLEYAEEFRRLN